MRSHPFHWLLLGGPDRFPGTGQVARGHHQIPCSNGQMEGQRVDRYKGIDTTPVYALRAKLFKEVTGQDLQGLSHFTGWIGQGGYYHWRVVQQGLIHLVPQLAGQSMPRTPDAHPSGKPLPPKPAQTKTLSTGASWKQPDRTQPAPGESRQEPTPNQGGRPSTSSQSETTTAPRQGRKSSTPCQSGEPASTSGSGTPAASGGPSNLPPGKRRSR